MNSRSPYSGGLAVDAVLSSLIAASKRRTFTLIAATIVVAWLALLLTLHSVLAQPQTIPCQPIYFWGGGKAGSTTLASLLKHDFGGKEWDARGEFINAPKEICWAERIRDFGPDPRVAKFRKIIAGKCHDGPNGKRFVLDACPRYHTPEQARMLVNDNPEAKFIMLVRDPIDRMVSHLNDGRRGVSINVEHAARELLERYVDGGKRKRGRKRRMGDHEGGGVDEKDDIDSDEKSGVYDAFDPQQEGEMDNDITPRRRRRLTDRKPERIRNRKDRTVGRDKGRRADRGRRGEKKQRDGLERRQGERRNREGHVERRMHGDVLGQPHSVGMGIPERFREKFRRTGRMGKDQWTLSLYGKNLQSLLSAVHPSRVLIVQTDALTKDPQAVVDAVMRHIGGRPKTVQSLHQNKLQDRGRYQTIRSHELRLELQNALRSDVELLERLVRRRFSWAWTEHSPGADDDPSWLTMVPDPPHHQYDI